MGKVEVVDGQDYNRKIVRGRRERLGEGLDLLSRSAREKQRRDAWKWMTRIKEKRSRFTYQSGLASALHAVQPQEERRRGFLSILIVLSV